MNNYWPWLTVALLGAYHGLNPAMGWLFAVALGLQERRRAVVLRAFVPIALGHAASIGLVVVLVVVAQAFITPEALQLTGAAALIAFGIYKLLAPMSHPRWVGMRVSFRDLIAWSFLMATAHGAGLMLLPVALRIAGATTAYAAAPNDSGAHMAPASYICGMALPAPWAELGAVALHTGAMFLVMGMIAMVVYEKLGLAILRRAWINLDRIWAVALIASGVLSFVL